MRHRRWGIAALGLGVTLLIGAIGFRTVAAPALVRFPLNVDQTVTYTGTALTYVDPATLLPLAKPEREPLQIRRRVKVVSGTFTKAVVDETVTVKTGGTTTRRDVPVRHRSAVDADGVRPTPVRVR
jgi:Porin PorA